VVLFAESCWWWLFFLVLVFDIGWLTGFLAASPFPAFADGLEMARTGAD
jgi:hypothetical protein